MPTGEITGGKHGEWRGWSPTSSSSSLGDAVGSPAPAPKSTICAWLSSLCCCKLKEDPGAYQVASG